MYVPTVYIKIAEGVAWGWCEIFCICFEHHVDQ